MTTDADVHEADVLVVALGADYDLEATPGLAEGGNEFYSVGGAERLREVLPSFSQGRAIIGVLRSAVQVPAGAERGRVAPPRLSLVARGAPRLRDLAGHATRESGSLLPPETSRALLAAFAERDIDFVAGLRPTSLDPSRGVALLDDGSEMPFDLFLGVPVHRAPDVVLASGMTADGYIPVDPKTLETRFPDVYAVGDVVTFGQPVPMAGVFAEGQARVVASSLIARIQGGEQPGPYNRRWRAFEFGGGRVGQVEVDFLSGPKPTGTFREPSEALVAEKERFQLARAALLAGSAADLEPEARTRPSATADRGGTSGGTELSARLQRTNPSSPWSDSRQTSRRFRLRSSPACNI